MRKLRATRTLMRLSGSRSMMRKPVEMREIPDALDLRDGVGRNDLVERPVVERVDGDEQELRIGDELGFLFARELRKALGLVLDQASEIRDLDAEELANPVEPPERERLSREHALDARLAHLQAARDVRVGHPATLQHLLQRGDQRPRLSHDGGSSR